MDRADLDDWLKMRIALWPEHADDHRAEIPVWFDTPPPRVAVFIARIDARAAGFVEVGLRDYAEDCSTSPVGYVEGIYVRPELRGRGVGRALLGAGERWARARGCTEMASDRALDNEVSGRFHEAVGFQETVRLVAYRKDLRP